MMKRILAVTVIFLFSLTASAEWRRVCYTYFVPEHYEVVAVFTGYVFDAYGNAYPTWEWCRVYVPGHWQTTCTYVWRCP